MAGAPGLHTEFSGGLNSKLPPVGGTLFNGINQTIAGGGPLQYSAAPDPGTFGGNKFDAEVHGGGKIKTTATIADAFKEQTHHGITNASFSADIAFKDKGASTGR